ncbi:hypothetical protein ES708_27537 [subsurface metagenome]
MTSEKALKKIPIIQKSKVKLKYLVFFFILSTSITDVRKLIASINNNTTISIVITEAISVLRAYLYKKASITKKIAKREKNK